VNTHPAFQAPAALLALAAAGLLWFPGRQRYPRLILFFVIAGVGGLVDLGLGFVSGIHGAITGLFHYVDDHTHAWVGSGVTFIAVVVLAVIVTLHVINASINEKTLAAGAGVALTASFVPGILGEALLGLVALCVNLSGQLFYWPFHGHF
jgi:hypothetical protein